MGNVWVLASVRLANAHSAALSGISLTPITTESVGERTPSADGDCIFFLTFAPLHIYNVPRQDHEAAVARLLATFLCLRNARQARYAIHGARLELSDMKITNPRPVEGERSPWLHFVTMEKAFGQPCCLICNHLARWERKYARLFREETLGIVREAVPHSMRFVTRGAHSR